MEPTVDQQPTFNGIMATQTALALTPLPTLAATPIPLPTATPEGIGFAPTNRPASEEIIAQANGSAIYVSGLNICFAQPNVERPMFLAAKEDANRFTVSPDGEVAIAYTAEYIEAGGRFAVVNKFWTVGEDRQVRLLASTEEFAAEFPEASAEVFSWAWIPGTHKLAFNTGLLTSRSYNDLHILDTDTGDYQMLLPPSIPQSLNDPRQVGGEIYPSPDGQRIALVTAASVSLINVDGSNWQPQVLLYDHIVTYSEYWLLVQPVWSPRSDGVYLAVPPTNGESQIEVWFVSVGGEVRGVGVLPFDVPEEQAEPITPLIRMAAASLNGDYVAYFGEGDYYIRALNGEPVLVDLPYKYVIGTWIDESHFTLEQYNTDYFQREVKFIVSVDGSFSSVEPAQGDFAPCFKNR